MAHIEERKLVSGKLSYKAQIFCKIDGKRKKFSETFDNKATAHSWAKKMERRIKKNGPEYLLEKSRTAKTVADAINRYIQGYHGDLKKPSFRSSVMLEMVDAISRT